MISKFIQIACSDSPASDGVREGRPILYALDEAGDVWTHESYRAGDEYVKGWVKIPRQELHPAQSNELPDEERSCIRQEAIEEVANDFGLLDWLCLDHGGEEVEKIRKMIYAVRDRKTVSSGSEKKHVCASCNGHGTVCDMSISGMELARRQDRSFIPGCLSPEHTGFRPCPECSDIPRKDVKS